MTAPRQTTASNLRDSARRRAATGISKAPGTRTTVMSLSPTPCRRRQSSAPSRRRSEMKSLNRLITRAIRSPFPSRLPATTRIDTCSLQSESRRSRDRSGRPRALSRTRPSSGNEAGTEERGPGGGEGKLEHDIGKQQHRGDKVPGAPGARRGGGGAAEPATGGEQHRFR